MPEDLGDGEQSSATRPQFALNHAQQAFVAEIHDVASTVLAPLAAAGEPGRVNRPLLAAMGEHGLLGRLFPGVGVGVGGAAAGGSGEPADRGADLRQAAALDLCLLRETIAGVSPEAETALALQGLGGYPILQSGTDAQIATYLPGIASGSLVAAYALTEPEAGSDAAALRLAADPDGDGWRLTGSKMWISNAPDADVYTVFTRTTTGAGARGVSAFVVPADRRGLSGEHLEMLSAHPIGTVVFDGVRVDRSDLLGEVDRGFRVAMRTLDLFRPSVGAFTIGMAQAALDAAVRHAVTRPAFGGTLADRQAVAHLLAEARTRVEAARLLVYAAAAAYDRGEHSPAMSAMAKLLATETAQSAIDAAIQIHGARALRSGHLLEHLYRDVRATRIYEGASEVQRDIIAKDMLAAARESLTQDESRGAGGVGA
jgi:alkylation response protein AidB-like acyl-CoA dehydrogenase